MSQSQNSRKRYEPFTKIVRESNFSNQRTNLFSVTNIMLLIIILALMSTLLKPLLNSGGSYFGIPFSLGYLRTICLGALFGFVSQTLIVKFIKTPKNFDLGASKKFPAALSVGVIVALLFQKGREFWNCFYFVPDSPGWLANPHTSQTVRPGLIRWFYERFITTEQISFTFYSDPSTKYNQAICNPLHNFLVPIRVQVCFYLISLLLLILSFRKIISYRHLILLTLLIVSGYSGAGEFVNRDFYDVAYALIGIILGIDVGLGYQSRRERNQQGKKKTILALFCFYTFFIPATYFNFVIPEINAVQSEAIAYGLLNLSLSCFITAWFMRKEEFNSRIYLMPLGLFFAGLLATARLSTIGAVICMLLMCIVVFIEHKVKILVVLMSALAFLLPILLIQNSSYKPEGSMSFWGPVAYALYSIDVANVDVKFSTEEHLFVKKAIDLANVAFTNSETIKKTSRPMWPNTGVYLYYGAIPAAQELDIGGGDPKKLNDFFERVFRKTFTQSPLKFLGFYFENAKIALGLYRPNLIPPVSEFNSRIFYGPFSFICILVATILIARVKGKRFLVPSLLMTSIYASGMLAAVFFDGPSRRNLASNDLYFLPIVILLWIYAGNFLKEKVKN